MSSSWSARSLGSVVGRRRRGLEIVLGQVTEQSPRKVERLGFVARRQVGDAADRRVGGRAAQSFGVNILVGHGLHDIRAGDEHVARALDHDDVVGHRRRVHRAAGARTEDDRDLGNDAGRQHVAQEDVGIAAKRHHALLDPGATGIVETDDRRADLHRQVHDLADLAGVGLRQGAAEDREVLREDEDQPAVDGAVAGDHAIAEIVLAVRIGRRGAVRDERVELDERSGSSSSSRRSRAVSLPISCCRSIRSAPATEQRFRAHLAKAGDPLVVRRHDALLDSSETRLCARTAAHRAPPNHDSRPGRAGRPQTIHRIGEQLPIRVDKSGGCTRRRWSRMGARSPRGERWMMPIDEGSR